jgi:hypothetical protein
MAALPQGMSDAELVILRETEPSALPDLVEDDLLELRARVRRVRNTHVGQYRRQATARVQEAGARGAAHARGQRARDKAEVFEVALARVSTALAKAARRSAAELRAERLAAVRTGGAGPIRTERATDSLPPVTSDLPPARSPARRKRDSSSLAQGARRQARRDARG